MIITIICKEKRNFRKKIILHTIFFFRTKHSGEFMSADHAKWPKFNKLKLLFQDKHEFVHKRKC